MRYGGTCSSGLVLLDTLLPEQLSETAAMPQSLLRSHPRVITGGRGGWGHVIWAGSGGCVHTVEGGGGEDIGTVPALLGMTRDRQ